MFLRKQTRCYPFFETIVFFSQSGIFAPPLEGRGEAAREHEDGGSEHAAVDIVKAILESVVHLLLAQNVDEGVHQHHAHDGDELGEVERPLATGVHCLLNRPFIIAQ